MKAAVLALALVAASCAAAPRADAVDPFAVEASATTAQDEAQAWSMKATIIEACSCPMFCQCYFNTEPAQHPGCCPPGADPADAPRYCKFNNAFQVDEGSHGDTSLAGVKFWLGGDLGSDFSQGKMAWVRLHFDPSVSEAQRAGILEILPKLYPVEWDRFEVGEDHAMTWDGGRDRSVAKLDGGKVAEVVLVKNQGMTDEPIVIHNLTYWGAPRNEGFVLMQNEVQAYRIGAESFETKGTNGFMITLEISSEDAAGDGGY